MTRDRQPELPGMTPGQPRNRRPEPVDFHARIVALRKEGHRVYRAGNDFAMLDGKLASRGGIWAKPAIPGPPRGPNGGKRGRRRK